MSARIKTEYPGVYYREVQRIGKPGNERVYYVVFKKNGKTIEEKAGRQHSDDMTPYRASIYRSDRIEGKRLSRREVREAERAAREAEKAEMAAEANKWTVDKLYKEYKKSNPNLKGWRTYDSFYQLHLKPEFGEKEPREILPLDVYRVRNRLLKKRSAQTVQHILELLRRIVNFGVNSRLCEGLNFRIEMPTVDNIKTEDLDAAQLKKLLETIEKSKHPHAGQLMKMALFTGMRRGELFRLQWRDVDFDRGFIHLRNPKGGRDEKIPLNDAARQILEDLKKKRKGRYVFPGRSGKQRTTIQRQVSKIRDDAKLPKSFRPIHGLRHVYASMLASSGQVDMYTLQKLLTHKDPKMTQRYAHLRDESLQKASNLAGSLVEEIVSKKDENDESAEG